VNFTFLRDRARPFLPELALISGLSLVSALASLAIPWLAGSFLAGVLGDAVVDLETTVVLLVIALAGLTVVNILVAILSELASGRILSGLRRETYDHLMALPIGFHDQNRSGELLSLMTYETSQLSSFLTRTLAGVPSMVMTAVGAVILLFVLDPVMTLVVPVLVALFLLVMKLVGRRLRVLARRARKADVRLISLGSSDLEMLPAIKAFAVEGAHQRDYYDASERARLLGLQRTRISAFIGPVVSLLAGLAAIGILLIGSGQIAEGVRTPAELFSFLLYAALLTRPASGLADTYGAFQMARGTLARLGAVFGKHAEPGYSAARQIVRAKGAIAFEGVDFAYPGRPQVLSSINLAIAPGEVVALTGPNGAGKSTMIRLLLRFYDPQGGRITLDGEDIATAQVQSLRRQFGYVPQRPLMLNATIRENIIFGAEDRDPARLERAARMAQAWDFIGNLPQGMETVIGDDGVRLSGGQQQRVALARALYRDPPIYIFDEATSMYDLEGEAAFVETCVSLLEGRTVIIITHRPASLALANRVLNVTETGLEVV
jgi:ATP-binding cassette, subfamily B, bacterial